MNPDEKKPEAEVEVVPQTDTTLDVVNETELDEEVDVVEGEDEKAKEEPEASEK